MAINNDPNFLIDDKVDGHDVFCYIPVRALAGFKLEPFMVDYNIDCPDLSTSWRLAITYKHNPETGKVVCFVTLGRIDAKREYVNVYVLVSYLDDNGRIISYPKPIGNNAILAGDKIQGHAEESRHPGYRSYIFSLGLILRVSILVRYCHPRPKFHAKACIRTVEKEMNLSKM